MNTFTQVGMDTFNDGIASGMPPEQAANAAGDAMGAAATDMGFPADMVADGVASGMETFTQAMANGGHFGEPHVEHQGLVLTRQRCPVRHTAFPA